MSKWSIADEFAKVVRYDDPIEDVLDACVDIMTFVIAQLCPTCRRAMATWLKDNTTNILAEAEQRAAEMKLASHAALALMPAKRNPHTMKPVELYGLQIWRKTARRQLLS